MTLGEDDVFFITVNKLLQRSQGGNFNVYEKMRQSKIVEDNHLDKMLELLNETFLVDDESTGSYLGKEPLHSASTP